MNDVEILADELMFALAKLGKCTIKSKDVSDLTEQEKFVMTYMFLHQDDYPDGVPCQSISLDNRIRKEALSRTMRSLINKKYVKRSVDAKNFRCVSYSLTSKGVLECHAIHDAVNKEACEYIRHLGIKDSKTLLNIINKVVMINESNCGSRGE